MQPFHRDRHGVTRFRSNAIVRHLLDFATPKGCSLNELACLPFSKEDRQQFAQLIGYSLSGYGELPYVTDAAWREAAEAQKSTFKKRAG